VEDDEEFVERITYRETRLYVKLVLRNRSTYRRIKAVTSPAAKRL